MTPSPPPRNRRGLALLAGLLGLICSLRLQTADAELNLRRWSVELPGAPAAVVTTDLDGDGRRDLAIVVVYTVWDQIGIEETLQMDEVEGLMEVLTIVPALLDHRELFLFRGAENGGFQILGEPLPLPASVVSLEAGPPGSPLLALTDDGVSRLERDGESAAFTFRPWIDEPPALAGARTFVKDLRLLRNVDGDDAPDLLIPARGGYALYLNPDPESRVSQEKRALFIPISKLDGNPPDRTLRYPFAEVRDIDGDGRADLLFPHPKNGWDDFRLLRQLGSGRFSEPLAPLSAFREAREAREERSARAAREKDTEDDFRAEEIVFFDDLDGDGKAEYVTLEEQDKGRGDGLRAGLDEAKRPSFLARLYRQGAGGAPSEDSYSQFLIEGYAFVGDAEFALPGGFQDLDGDGRQDLVALTLDFSLLQAVKIMAVRRISIGLDFHVWCQEGAAAAGLPRFRRVPGLDLSGKFTLNLDNLRLGRLSQFAGDFDGDGRADFVQMGRGRSVTVHRGRAGCTYPAAPDLTLQLDAPPKDLSLVEVRDFNGDGRADLLLLDPRPPKDPGTSGPVRLDLYLTGGQP